jgi:hypothetical protein
MNDGFYTTSNAPELHRQITSANGNQPYKNKSGDGVPNSFEWN